MSLSKTFHILFLSKENPDGKAKGPLTGKKKTNVLIFKELPTTVKVVSG